MNQNSDQREEDAVVLRKKRVPTLDSNIKFDCKLLYHVTYLGGRYIQFILDFSDYVYMPMMHSQSQVTID